MLTLTVRELICAGGSEIPEGEGYCLYLVRDGELVLYVGKSADVSGRLIRHVTGDGLTACHVDPERFHGYPTSDLGRLIRDHARESFGWSVDLFTGEDCAELVKRHFPEAAGYDRYDAERALIREHRPALNVTHNADPRPLPEKYRDSPEIEDAKRKAASLLHVPYSRKAAGAEAKSRRRG